MHSSSLPPPDSPLTPTFLGQYVMPRFRTLLLITSVLLILQATVIWRMGGYPIGAVLSKTVQFVLGLMCLLMFVGRYQRPSVY